MCLAQYEVVNWKTQQRRNGRNSLSNTWYPFRNGLRTRVDRLQDNKQRQVWPNATITCHFYTAKHSNWGSSSGNTNEITTPLSFCVGLQSICCENAEMPVRNTVYGLSKYRSRDQQLLKMVLPTIYRLINRIWQHVRVTYLDGTVYFQFSTPCCLADDVSLSLWLRTTHG